MSIIMFLFGLILSILIESARDVVLFFRRLDLVEILLVVSSSIFLLTSFSSRNRKIRQLLFFWL